ncbi:neutrophil gelatinase-associated lipocalin-like [Octodon degus]|uniref:Neutrophil gelatinase-associated lipocalin-like n=1 Tax=Octodon degus TaxID=10160 RepID=A0A6P3VDC2_OCTDE|nr:neutrophil gelatinase-associated lipocalin-like [Octodon degus]
MALALLWLGFTLLWALQTHAKYSPLYQNLSQSLGPSLSINSLQPDFKADKGKWYAIGVAVNDIHYRKESRINMYSNFFYLKKKDSCVLSTLILMEGVCEIWFEDLSSSGRPGEFTLRNINDISEIENYTLRVVSTDYKHFALVFLKVTVPNSEHIIVTLYGRTKKLGRKLKRKFIKFSKSVGLTKKNIIFTNPIACQCLQYLSILFFLSLLCSVVSGSPTSHNAHESDERPFLQHSAAHTAEAKCTLLMEPPLSAK